MTIGPEPMIMTVSISIRLGIEAIPDFKRIAQPNLDWLTHVLYRRHVFIK